MTGRFCQRDPLGTIAGPSAYQYCDSRPSTLVDPLGLIGNEDDRPLGPQPVGFNPQITGSSGSLYAGGTIGHFQQSMSILGSIPGLCMRQELKVAIHLWKQGEKKGPSWTIRIHIVEYFPMFSGKTGGDLHKSPISREHMDEGFCAFVVNVWAKIEVGTVETPLDGWSYSVATIADPETAPPKDFNMSSSRTMGDPGNNRIADPGFKALAQASYYTYSQAANWCEDRNLRGEIPGKCPDNLRRPRPTTDSDSGAVTTPSEPSKPTESPPPGAPGGR